MVYARKTAALLLMASLSANRPVEFVESLPGELPDTRGWERVTGRLERPDMVATYELYTNPSRWTRYEVIRYRLTPKGAVAPDSSLSTTEKVQWDIDGRLLRRWECLPAGPEARDCAWHELARDSDRYRREVYTILWILGGHRGTLHALQESLAP